MGISFVGISSHPGGSGASSLSVDLSLASDFDLMILAFAFEGVAAGSGPWITPDIAPGTGAKIGPGDGWKQFVQQAPSATGVGLEVWAAILTSGSSVTAGFDASHNVQAVAAIYSGEYYGARSPYILDGAIRAAVSQPVAGDNPECPSIHAFVDEVVIAIGADTLASPGFGTPTPPGWASRGDYNRSGYGTAEVTFAERPTTSEGDTGPIPFSASASPSGAKGATATLAIRPFAASPAATSPLIAVEFAVAT